MLKGGKIIKKKIIALSFFIVFILNFFIFLPCSAKDTIHELNKIDSFDKEPACLSSSLAKCNRPFPPLMWTVNFTTFFISNPNSDNKPIFYLINWGDGTSSNWIGPYDLCETVEISHIWDEEGNYTIKVKSKICFSISETSVYYLQLLSDMKIFNPSIGYVGITYIFTINWVWGEGDDYFIEILWGDGTVEEWVGPYAYNDVIILSFSWDSPGKYSLKLRFRDVNGLISDWLFFSIIILPLDNNAPFEPLIIGPPIGKKGNKYCFSFITIDLDGDDVFYEIDWGDGTPIQELGPYSSGKRIKKSHQWLEKGIYTVKCKARDVYYAESQWMTNYINIPRNRASINFQLQIFIDMLPKLHKLFYYIGI